MANLLCGYHFQILKKNTAIWNTRRQDSTTHEKYIYTRVDNGALWFLKLPHSEAKAQVIYNVNILGGSSSVLELLETIGNSDLYMHSSYRVIKQN